MKALTIAAALLASTALAGAAQAQTVVALVGDDTLAMVDVGAKKVEKDHEGIRREREAARHRRPSARRHAVWARRRRHHRDHRSGDRQGHPESKLDTMLPAGAMATVDFNPVADRLRSSVRTARICAPTSMTASH
jgi:hypothetical protein